VFDCNKLLVLMRNPLDTIYSMVQYQVTFNHCQKASFEFERDYPDWWDEMVRHYTAMIRFQMQRLISDSTD
jgi:hypothetical protein